MKKMQSLLFSTARYTKNNFRTFSLVYLLLLCFSVFASLETLFFSAHNIENIFSQLSIIGFISIGMFLVLARGHIDLSVGAVAGFSSILMAYLISNGFPVFIAILLTLLSAVFIGCINGYLISFLKINSLAVTFAAMIFYRQLAFKIAGGTSLPIPDSFFFKTYSSYIPNFLPGISEQTNIVTIAIGIFLVIFYLFIEKLKVKNINQESQDKLPQIGKIFKNLFFCFLIIIFFILTSRSNGIRFYSLLFLIAFSGLNLFYIKSSFGKALYLETQKNDTNINSHETKKYKTQTLLLFILLNLFSALAGISFTARISGASPTLGSFFEIEIFIILLLAGANLKGKNGNPINLILSLAIFSAVKNGLNFLSVSSYTQILLQGIILLFLLWFNTVSHKINSYVKSLEGRIYLLFTLPVISIYIGTILISPLNNLLLKSSILIIAFFIIFLVWQYEKNQKWAKYLLLTLFSLSILFLFITFITLFIKGIPSKSMALLPFNIYQLAILIFIVYHILIKPKE